jgi:hypothetical protein
MKSDFILNVDISSSKKISIEEFNFFKEEMESNFPYNEFSLILIENSELNRNGMEIYIEDLEMEFDLTEDIESAIEEIDSIISTSKGSRIEWYSSISISSRIWEKTTSGWQKRDEEGETDFYEDSFFGFDD